MAEAADNELQPGTRVLRRYQIVGKLAQGGMAEVYLARQQGPGGYQKLVVIKRVRPHLAKDEDFVAMFVNEARLAAMINHPNVVQIFDLGQENGDWFLAMEYLDGRDMLQVGRACRAHNKAVPFDVTARIIADACSGLEYAHNLRGADGKPLDLVHRDMSPENVIITFEGQVKVVDFGIAKASDNAFRTQAGQIKGKLGYVAPEAILGKQLDGRADIFAVGATLYLFLSGRPAFSGTSPMEIFERSLKPPQPPGEVNPRVPPALDQICMKCLAQDRDKRFRTAGEVRGSLDGYLAGTGRPLGAPQLAQFMKILFPPEKDPVRQRIDKLLLDAATWEATNSSVSLPEPPPKAGTPRTVSVPAVPQYSGSGEPHAEDDESTQVVGPERTQRTSGAPPAIELPGPSPRPATRPTANLKSLDVQDVISVEGQTANSLPPPSTRPSIPKRVEKTVVLDDELLLSGVEQSVARGKPGTSRLDEDEVDLSMDDGPSMTVEGDAEGTAVVADGVQDDEIDALVGRLEEQQQREQATRRRTENGAPRGTEIPPPFGADRAEPTHVTATPMPEAEVELPEPSIVVDDPSFEPRVSSSAMGVPQASAAFDMAPHTDPSEPPAAYEEAMASSSGAAVSRGDAAQDWGMGVKLAMLAFGAATGLLVVVGALVATGKLDAVLARF